MYCNKIVLRTGTNEWQLEAGLFGHVPHLMVPGRGMPGTNRGGYLSRARCPGSVPGTNSPYGPGPIACSALVVCFHYTNEQVSFLIHTSQHTLSGYPRWTPLLSCYIRHNVQCSQSTPTEQQ